MRTNFQQLFEKQIQLIQEGKIVELESQLKQQQYNEYEQGQGYGYFQDRNFDFNQIVNVDFNKLIAYLEKETFTTNQSYFPLLSILLLRFGAVGLARLIDSEIFGTLQNQLFYLEQTKEYKLFLSLLNELRFDELPFEGSIKFQNHFKCLNKKQFLSSFKYTLTPVDKIYFEMKFKLNDAFKYKENISSDQQQLNQISKYNNLIKDIKKLEKEFRQIQKNYDELTQYVLSLIQKEISIHEKFLYQIHFLEEMNHFYQTNEQKLIILIINRYFIQNKYQVIVNREILSQRKQFLINEIIQVNEDYHTEFKYFNDAIDKLRSFVIKKAVTAFLNAQGGILYIGITDDKNVVGFPLHFHDQTDFLDFLTKTVELIEPQPRLNIDFFVDVLPIVDQQGRQYNDKAIIKIRVERNLPEVYQFSEFNDQVQSEAIYCFQRSMDSSRFLKFTQIKDLILKYQINEKINSHTQSAENIIQAGDEHVRFSSVQKERNKYINNDQFSKQKEIRSDQYLKTKFEANKMDQIVNEIDVKKKNLPQEEFQKAIFIRKIHQDIFNELLNQVKEFQANKIIYKFFNFSNHNILLICSSKDYIPEIKQNLTLMIQKYQDKKLQYTFGIPADTLKLQQWKSNIDQDDIDNFQTLICENLKLYNFRIFESKPIYRIKSQNLNDLIKIYEMLKPLYEIHWELNEQQTVKSF